MIVFIERFSLERLPRAREARHDRADWNFHDSRDLLVGKRLHFAQDETFSPCDWKRVERVVKCGDILPLHQCRLGTGVRIGYVPGALAGSRPTDCRGHPD